MSLSQKALPYPGGIESFNSLTAVWSHIWDQFFSQAVAVLPFSLLNLNHLVSLQAWKGLFIDLDLLDHWITSEKEKGTLCNSNSLHVPPIQANGLWDVNRFTGHGFNTWPTGEVGGAVTNKSSAMHLDLEVALSIAHSSPLWHKF